MSMATVTLKNTKPAIFTAYEDAMNRIAELEALLAAKTPQSKPTDATRVIVGNIVKGSPVFPQVQAFAKTHGVSTTKVVITGERMTIK